MTPHDEEAIFATIGLDDILAAKPTLHKYQLQQAAGLPKTIRRRVLRFMSSDAYREAVDMLPFDYDEAQKVIDEGQTPAQAAALFAVTPDRELATDLGLRADAMLDWAKTELPRPQPGTAWGAAPVPPDDVQIADFRRLWQVARAPLTVLDDLEDGSLTAEQVAMLQQFFPAIYAEMRQAVTEARAAISARLGDKWEPPSNKTALLGILMQQETMDLQLAAEVQQVYAQQGKPQQAAAPARKKPAGGGSDDVSEGALTPGQKAKAG